MDPTPHAKPNSMPLGEDDEDFEPDDPFLSDTPDEDFPHVASASPPNKHDDSELDYYNLERAAARKRRINIGITVALATITVPFLYLLLSGDLRGIRHKPVPIVVPRAGATKAHSIQLTPAQKLVAADLHDYLWNIVKANSSDENAALDGYASVTGTNFKDGSAVFREVKQVVLPKYIAFATKMSNVHPKTIEVSELHKMLLATIVVRLKGYQDVAAAEGAKGNLWQYGVRGEFEGANELQANYQQAVIRKAHELGVDLPQ